MSDSRPVASSAVPVRDRAEAPAVAVVACVRDEEAYLAEAARSVLAQDYAGTLRLVLAVGPSHDATAEVAAALAAADPRVDLVDNPTGSRSIGLNAAIETSAPFAGGPGDLLVRVDGHTVLPPDYVRRAVATLGSTGAVGVGGR